MGKINIFKNLCQNQKTVKLRSTKTSQNCKNEKLLKTRLLTKKVSLLYSVFYFSKNPMKCY